MLEKMKEYQDGIIGAVLGSVITYGVVQLCDDEPEEVAVKEKKGEGKKDKKKGGKGKKKEGKGKKKD